MADRFPLIVDSSALQIKELPSGDNLDLTGNSITGVVDITASGDVSIGGTLTYQDVSNVDSVGLITARSGIRVGAGQSIGSTTATENVVYYGDGSNLSGFGDEESDYLIEKIRTTMNENDRYQLYMDLQEKIVKEHPYIFLISPAMCTAISKRFTKN